MLKISIIIIGVILLFKYRWEIFAACMGPTEPCGDDEDLPEIYDTAGMDQDYKNIKNCITSCESSALLEATFQVIKVFQLRFKGPEAERMSAELFGFYEAKKEEMYLINNSIST